MRKSRRLGRNPSLRGFRVDLRERHRYLPHARVPRRLVPDRPAAELLRADFGNYWYYSVLGVRNQPSFTRWNQSGGPKLKPIVSLLATRPSTALRKRSSLARPGAEDPSLRILPLLLVVRVPRSPRRPAQIDAHGVREVIPESRGWEPKPSHQKCSRVFWVVPQV